MTAQGSPPARIDLGDGTCLRFLTLDDADAVARAVGESLEHLRPWMPWAGEQSADPAFQRERIAKLPDAAARGEEWQYGLFAAEAGGFIGSFGMMTRRGPGTIELGYWLHARAVGRGYATAAAGALTDVARAMPGVRRVLIYCDEANAPSAAVARRLGYSLVRTEHRAPEAPAETGRQMVWAREAAETRGDA